MEGSADDRALLLESTWKAALDMSDDVESNVACDYDSIRETASVEKIRPQQDKGPVKIACDLLLKAHASLESAVRPTNIDDALSYSSPTLLDRALEALNNVYIDVCGPVGDDSAIDSVTSSSKSTVPLFSGTNIRHASRVIELLIAATESSKWSSDSVDGLIAFDSIPHGIRGTFSAFQIKVIFRDFRKRRVSVDRKAINDKLNEYVSGEDTSLYPQNSLGAVIEDNNRSLRSDAVSHDDFRGSAKIRAGG